MRTMKRAFLAGGIGVALLLGALAFILPRALKPVPVGTEPGYRAPDFRLARLDTGEEVSLSQFRGHVVLLLFWQSTCPDCRRAMPYFEDLRVKFSSRGLVVLGVDLDHDPDAARRYLREHRYGLIPLWGSFDAAMEVVKLYEVPLVPHVVLIDKKGIIRFRGTYPDVPTPEDIERWL